MSLDFEDWMVVLAVLFIIGCHASTRFIVSYRTSSFELEETVKAYVEIAEGNPLARPTLFFGQLQIILTYLLIPGFVGGAYYVARKHSPEIKSFFAVTFFLVALLNICNDLPVLMGMLARGGT